eukprot:g12972.t1
MAAAEIAVIMGYDYRELQIAAMAAGLPATGVGVTKAFLQEELVRRANPRPLRREELVDYMSHDERLRICRLHDLSARFGSNADMGMALKAYYRELEPPSLVKRIRVAVLGTFAAVAVMGLVSFLQEKIFRRANPRPLRREELVDYMSRDERWRICPLHDLSARFGSNADMGVALKAYYRELEPPSLVKRIRVAVLRTFAAVAVMGLVMFGLGALHHSREVSAVTTQPCVGVVSDIVDRVDAGVPPSGWTSPTPAVGEHASVANSGSGLEGILALKYYEEDEEDVNETVASRFNVDAVVEPAFMPGVVDERAQTASPSRMTYVVEGDGDNDVIVEDIEDVAAPVDSMVEPVMIVEVVSKAAATTLSNEATAAVPPSDWTTPTPGVGQRTSVADCSLDDIADPAFYAEEEHVDEAVSARFDVDAVVEAAVISGVADEEVQTASPSSMSNVVEVDGEEEIIIKDIEDVAAPVDTMVEPVMIVEVVSKPAATTLLDEAAAAVPPSEWTTPTPAVGERTSVADWSLDDIAYPPFYAEEEHVDEAVSARFDVDAVLEAAVISGVADEEVQTASPSSMSNVVEVNGELPSKIDAGICCPVSWCQVSDASYFRGTDSDKCGCSFNPTRMTSGPKNVPGVTTADYVARKPVPASAVTRPTGKDGGGFSTTATREDSASLVPIAFVAEADPDNRALSGGSNADLAPLLQRMLEEQMAAAARGEALMARSMARSDLHFVVLCVLAIAVVALFLFSRSPAVTTPNLLDYLSAEVGRQVRGVEGLAHMAVDGVNAMADYTYALPSMVASAVTRLASVETLVATLRVQVSWVTTQMTASSMAILGVQRRLLDVEEWRRNMALLVTEAEAKLARCFAHTAAQIGSMWAVIDGVVRRVMGLEWCVAELQQAIAAQQQDYIALEQVVVELQQAVAQLQQDD